RPAALSRAPLEKSPSAASGAPSSGPCRPERARSAQAYLIAIQPRFFDAWGCFADSHVPPFPSEHFMRKSGPSCASICRALRTPPMGSVDQGARTWSGHQGALIIGALGVVYGDIGTSPIYALRESIAATAGLIGTDNAVLGVLSLMF